MSSSLSFRIPKALPSLSPPYQRKYRLHSLISCQHNDSQHKKVQACSSISSDRIQDSRYRVLGLAVQVGGVLAAAAEPALAVTGVNDEQDLVLVLTQSAFVAFLYFIVAPPIIMNWLRTRWYKRNLLEMYLQFMFVFIFFPGVLLWAPFLNFRKLPRDPSMKYPWSVPENPSEIKGGYLKYPWAKPEDYELD